MRRLIPLHPFLFAAFPVLSLFAANVSRVQFRTVLPPLGVTLLATGALLVLLRLAVRDWKLAALIASLVTLAVLSYWEVASLLHRAGRYMGPQHDDLLMAAMVLLVAVGVVVLMAPGLQSREGLTRAANRVGVALVVIALVPYATTKVRLDSRTLPAPDVGLLALGAEVAQAPPDIYYLIFDRYAGRKTLQDLYDFDNAPFLDALADRDFYVADRSLSNYPTTGHSLASSLNMGYIDSGFDSPVQSDWEPIYQMLAHHQAGRILTDAGYRYTHVGAWFGATARSPLADENVVFNPVSEFSRTLYRKTLLYPAGQRLGITHRLVDDRRMHYELALSQFDAVARIHRDDSHPGPKFVFAHILVPHPPYVFDRDGNYLTEADELGRLHRVNYTEQLEFTNDKILELLDVLLADDGRRKPIVVVQSDEGPHPHRQETDHQFGWDIATLEEQREKFRILNAYHLPGDGKPEPYPTISPVNTFRLIFSRYLDGSLELLPDESYVFPRGRLYDFKSVDRGAVLGPEPRRRGTAQNQRR